MELEGALLCNQRPPLDPIVSQMNPNHTLTVY
jgi:hypothetical protein